MKLILARHGQTRANVDRVLDTLPPGYPLTCEGRRQATELAEALRAEPVVAVYASTAVRARQTAAPVAARHGLAPVELDGVQEVFVGDLEGRRDPDALELWTGIYRSWHSGQPDRRVPGGESGTEVLARYRAALTRLATDHDDGTVVLVSHGAAMRLAVATVVSNLGSDFAKDDYLPNASTVVLQTAGGNGWHCLRWNDMDMPG